MNQPQRIACVGAGFSGAVIARTLSESARFTVDVFDRRPHIAGNCFTERDPGTNIMVHRYGPHIFHTDDTEVWDWVQRFGEFVPFTNRVKAITAEGVFSLPVNLHTINQLFGTTLSPAAAREFMQTQAQRFAEPRNFEEQALGMIGQRLYRAFFYGYTKKQWGVEPTELPAAILRRLPVRFTYDDNYYNSRYQGLPRLGYTDLVSKILDHPQIHVHLETEFTPDQTDRYHHVFTSSPLDEWYQHRYGRLQYRTLDFEPFTVDGDFQGNPVINYCEQDIPWTRITEHKHFSFWEPNPRSVCFREYSRTCGPTDVPYYPLRLVDDKDVLKQYVAHAAADARSVTFVGRLGTYRYLDMDRVIREALDVSRNFLAGTIHRFSVTPL